MACPTCSNTMQNLGVPDARVFWCSRCGTIRTFRSDGASESAVPALIERIHNLKAVMTDRVGFHDFDKRTWHRLGIDEAINLPADRPVI